MKDIEYLFTIAVAGFMDEKRQSLLEWAKDLGLKLAILGSAQINGVIELANNPAYSFSDIDEEFSQRWKKRWKSKENASTIKEKYDLHYRLLCEMAEDIDQKATDMLPDFPTGQGKIERVDNLKLSLLRSYLAAAGQFARNEMEK